MQQRSRPSAGHGDTLRHILLALLLFALSAQALLPARPAYAASQIDIVGPSGSGKFGTMVTALSNGNIVVTDPFYDLPGVQDVGAVYLYNGATGALISTLTGSSPDDQIGFVTALSNSNFVVGSSYWDNSSIVDAGAMTWVNGTTGLDGVISIVNSLVGGSPGDNVGAWGVMALTNGNYVVRSPRWDNGAIQDVGAATWGNGAIGIQGVVSVENSLIGSSPYDQIGYNAGYDGLDLLDNGNYVVRSPKWDNGNISDAGAVTWVNGATGTSGVVSPINSLVGSSPNDRVGGYRVTPLYDGNYVVNSFEWDNDDISNAGAVTWGNGTTGTSGVISVTNSLVGGSADDYVGSPQGYYGVTALSNGNYLVSSPTWDNAGNINVGAVTWSNGATGITGFVSAANSLVGSESYDFVGGEPVTALSNGNYVVSSPAWRNGSPDPLGAVTWGNGATGISGVVSTTNSLVGSNPGDLGAGRVTALRNGNYVVSSPRWDNGAIKDAGAVTWGNGATGIVGVVSPANSLVGSSPDDQVGLGQVAALNNGNYVVSSYDWNNGGLSKAGAVTWGNGATGVIGVVSSANSLVGNSSDDQVGVVLPLRNGNYIVGSFKWDNGAIKDAGAVTWGNGATGISGGVSITNSLVGASPDEIGFTRLWLLSNGNYLVSNFLWDNGAIKDAGVVTWCNGAIGTVGVASPANSLVGSSPDDWVGFVERLPGLENGNFVLRSPGWDNGNILNAGAVTLGNGSAGTTVGPITAENSVLGGVADGGGALTFDYDILNQQLVVGRPLENIVTLFRPSFAPPNPPLYLPLVASE